MMFVNRNSRGGLTCRWAEPVVAELTFALSCSLSGDTLKLVTIAKSEVEMKRHGPMGLNGTFKALGRPSEAVVMRKD